MIRCVGEIISQLQYKVDEYFKILIENFKY